jgi:hypothetical protein
MPRRRHPDPPGTDETLQPYLSGWIALHQIRQPDERSMACRAYVMGVVTCYAADLFPETCETGLALGLETVRFFTDVSTSLVLCASTALIFAQDR